VVIHKPEHAALLADERVFVLDVGLLAGVDSPSGNRLGGRVPFGMAAVPAAESK